MQIYFDVASDGSIYQTTAVDPPQHPFGTVIELDSTQASVTDAQQNTSWYQVVNGSLVARPRFTLSATESNGQYTITATLNNPPSTPPTQATFTVCGQTYTESITNGQATFTLAIHPSLANYAVNVEVSATGCVSASTNIGGTALTPVALQSYTPSGGIPTAAPVGTGSHAFLETYYALNPLSIQSLIADIGTAVNLLLDTVFNVLLPQAQSATYAPLSLSANQSNAQFDIKANVLPNVFTTLANAFPSGGSKSTQYNAFAKDLALTFKNFESYENDLNSIPGLA